MRPRLTIRQFRLAGDSSIWDVGLRENQFESSMARWRWKTEFQFLLLYYNDRINSFDSSASRCLIEINSQRRSAVQEKRANEKK